MILDGMTVTGKQILMIGGMMTGIQSLMTMTTMMAQQMTIMSTMMIGIGDSKE